MDKKKVSSHANPSKKAARASSSSNLGKKIGSKNTLNWLTEFQTGFSIMQLRHKKQITTNLNYFFNKALKAPPSWRNPFKSSSFFENPLLPARAVIFRRRWRVGNTFCYKSALWGPKWWRCYTRLKVHWKQVKALYFYLSACWTD